MGQITAKEFLDCAPTKYRTDMLGLTAKYQNDLWSSLIDDVRSSMEGGSYIPWHNVFGSVALVHVGKYSEAIDNLDSCIRHTYDNDSPEERFSQFFKFAFYLYSTSFEKENGILSEQHVAAMRTIRETDDRLSAKIASEKIYFKNMSYQDATTYKNKLMAEHTKIQRVNVQKVNEITDKIVQVVLCYAYILDSTAILMSNYEKFIDDDYKTVKDAMESQWIPLLNVMKKNASHDIDVHGSTVISVTNAIRVEMEKRKDAIEKLLDGWEKYKADKLVQEYWDNNQDLFNQLKSELDNKNNRLQEITDEINKQKECINEENNKNPFNIPEQKDLEELTKVKEDILKEISGLGVLQFSKKKKCETELLNVSNEINKLSNTISEKQIAYNKEMNAILTPYKSKISELQEQERAIKAEIKRIQQQLDNPSLD